MKTKVDIISGFLGAGKTTLIKKLIEEKLYSEKLLIIENEFGEVGVDGQILKQANIEIKEINSGCICCTLAGDFENAINEVLSKYRPDRIIIEPSGVGKLSDIIKACESPRLENFIAVNMLIAVVDVMRYRVFIANFGEFFENQIRYAKTILLSRTQSIENNKLESIVKDIHKINDTAKIITTPWENLDSGLIIGIAEQNEGYILANQLNAGHDEKHTHSHSADEMFEVWGIETPKVYSEDELSCILEKLDSDKSFGYILRGKGILQSGSGNWMQFDYVPGEISIKAGKADFTGRICIIGKELDRSRLNNLFNL